MDRKFAIAISLVALILFSSYFLLSVKPSEKKVYKIGVLCGLMYISQIVDGLKEGMSELGYRENVDVVYDVQTTDFDVEAYRRIAQKFVDEKVDVIVSFPTEASMEVKEIIKGTGIQQVFVFANIEGTGLVESISKPGGNTTGVRYPGPDIALKRFEIMKELVPDVKKVLIPYQKGYPIVRSQLDVIYPAAHKLNISIIELPADNAQEISWMLQNYTDVDFILAIAEPLFVTPDAFSVLADFSAKNNIPLGGAYMKVGPYESIFGVNVEILKAGKNAAVLVDKIIKGLPAGSIPVYTSEYYFEISKTAANKFGLVIPENLLNMADKIY